MKRCTPLFLLSMLFVLWAVNAQAIVATPPPVTPQLGFVGGDEPAPDSRGSVSGSGTGGCQGIAGKPVAQSASPYPTPTPIIPTLEWDPNAAYSLKEERTVGAYTIRVWQNSNSDSLLGFDGIVTIQALGQPMAQVDMAAGLHELTGADITGEGHPDAIIETFSGGAHCCFSTVVYDLGPTLTQVLRTPESNCSGHFEDLDADGVMEFITCDDRFAYQYCCFAGSPAVKVIMKYTPGEGYLPASTGFRRLYAEDIANHTAAAETAAPGDFCEWDETTKCAVLPVVLDYLYSGQPDQAWSELARLYPYPDREQFRQEILAGVGESPLYVFP